MVQGSRSQRASHPGGRRRRSRSASRSGPRWTGQNRPFVDTSKPADFRRPETGVEIYFTASSVGNVFAGAPALGVHARSLWAARQPPVPTDPVRRPARATPRSRIRPAMSARRRATPGTVPATPGASARRRSTAVAAISGPLADGTGFGIRQPCAAPVTCLPLRVRQRHTTTPTPLRNGARESGPCLVWSPGWVPSRTSVLVIPGRSTLARRNGPCWAGRCGRRRRVGKGVPSSDHSSVAEGSSGARGDRGDDRWRLLRQASLEAALSRARTTSGWALTLGRARILRSAVQRRGNWRNAAHAFGRQPNAGYRRTGGGNVPTGFGLRPGAKAPDAPPTRHRLRASRRLYRGGPHAGAPAARPALEHVARDAGAGRAAR